MLLDKWSYDLIDGVKSFSVGIDFWKPTGRIKSTGQFSCLESNLGHKVSMLSPQALSIAGQCPGYGVQLPAGMSLSLFGTCATVVSLNDTVMDHVEILYRHEPILNRGDLFWSILLIVSQCWRNHIHVLTVEAHLSKLPVLDDVCSSAGNGCATARLLVFGQTKPHGWWEEKQPVITIVWLV